MSDLQDREHKQSAADPTVDPGTDDMPERAQAEAKSAGMHPVLRSLLAGLALSLTGVLCVLAVLYSYHSTAPLLQEQYGEKKLLSRHAVLLPPEALQEGVSVRCHLISDVRVGHNMQLYQFIKQRQVLAYLMTYSTSRGYADPLVLIAGFTPDKKLYKADILLSNETPGLGDKVERRHGDFMDALNGLGPEDKNFEVRAFGGDFDYIQGSTVTSRAVVLASYDALTYLRDSEIESLPPCKRSSSEP